MYFSINHSLIVLFALVSISAMADSEHHHSGMVGGWTPQDVNSDDMKKWANKAVSKFNEQSNDANQHIVTKIHSAESQVVAGVNYRLKVEFGRTECKKGSVCGENEPVKSTKIYNVNIFSQPWTQTEKISFEEA